MLVPSFQLTLTDPIREKRAAVGQLYEGHACFACATTGGQILVYNPNETPGAEMNRSQYIRVNRDITALASGRMLTDGSKKEHLFIGTSSSVQAFDCEQNRDLFYADVADGATEILVDKVGNVDEQVALVGGHGTLVAFDRTGTERLWTVTSDTVSALAAADVNNDGAKEILVGTEDAEVKIFDNEECVATMPEMDAVTSLCTIEGPRFAYALSNGTTGIYSRERRAWRVKSRHVPICIKGFDLDGDGVAELVSGWSNGKIEVRGEQNGQMVFKDSIGQGVASVLVGDLRRKGRDELVICGVDGEVRGYEGAVDEQRAAMVTNARKLSALTQQKQKLMAQLEQVEMAGKKMRDRDLQRQAQGQANHALPAGTKVLVEWQTAKTVDALELFVEASTDCLIRCIVLMAEGVFDDRESMVYCPEPKKTVSVPMRTTKDIAAIVHIKVFLSSTPTANVTHIYETDLDLPKFAMYSVIGRDQVQQEPSGQVTFVVQERVQRIALWIESAFNAKLPSLQNTQKIEAAFVSLRDRSHSLVRTKPHQTEGGNVVTIVTDNMTLAGDMVQDLCKFLQINELQSEAYFPLEMEALGKVLDDVSEYNANRIKFQAEAADASNAVKALVVRAEDARILQDMDGMLESYARLQDLNRDLLMEHEKRATNHKNLLEGLRKINQSIQAASRLRVGQAGTDVVAHCRNAIRQDNFQSLFTIMQQGVPR